MDYNKGIKFISSGLGAILNAVFHCGLLSLLLGVKN
jgi:hypothetical protein